MPKGKRGPRLDLIEDFETPVKLPAKDAFAKARKETGQDDEPLPEKFDAGEKQSKLPGMPDVPKPVRGKRMMAKFVTPHFTRTKNDDPMVSIELSFPLTPDHEGLLPPEVESAWKVIRKGNIKRIDVTGVVPQTASLALVPDEKDDLIIVAGEITHARLTVVEETGDGKSKEVIRYSFRIETDRSKEVTRFATTFDGDNIWYSAKETQASLLDK